MATLAHERCEPCHGGTPRLNRDDASILRGELNGNWAVEGVNVLTRTVRFKSFSAAFARATQVAMLAEAEQHHPDMSVGWRYLTIRLTTHAINGLSRNDFIMAAKIDDLDG